MPESLLNEVLHYTPACVGQVSADQLPFQRINHDGAMPKIVYGLTPRITCHQFCDRFVAVGDTTTSGIGEVVQRQSG